jgi:antitoxin VapB
LYILERKVTFYVKDSKTDKAVRKLAKLKGTTLTEAIRLAVEAELERESRENEEEAIDRLIARVAAMPNTGLKADKEFYDSLSED